MFREYSYFQNSFSQLLSGFERICDKASESTGPSAFG